MTVPQGIIIGVVALITLVGFVEASAQRGHEITLPRITLALLAPFFWIVLILGNTPLKPD